MFQPAMSELYANARDGLLPECTACVRRPGRDADLFFGLSCGEHLSSGPGTELLWVMRDPGREVGRTGRLCMIHLKRTSHPVVRAQPPRGVRRSARVSSLQVPTSRLRYFWRAACSAPAPKEI